MKQKCAPRDLRKISRAVHKYAFESLAWQVFVNGHLDDPPDLFDPRFDIVRAWARRGEPQHSARPFLRKPSERLEQHVETRQWLFEGEFCVEAKFFGEWWAVSLTTAHDDTKDKLRRWCSDSLRQAWWVADTLEAAAPRSRRRGFRFLTDLVSRKKPSNTGS